LQAIFCKIWHRLKLHIRKRWEPMFFRIKNGQLEQALLGEELKNCHPKTPRTWWQILRAVTCSMIWKDRNLKCFEGEDTALQATIRKIWHRLKLHLRNGWKPLYFKIKKGQMSVAEARTDFIRDFGSDSRFYTFEGNSIIAAGSVPDMSEATAEEDRGV
jgi:hypothetical protein